MLTAMFLQIFDSRVHRFNYKCMRVYEYSPKFFSLFSPEERIERVPLT